MTGLCHRFVDGTLTPFRPQLDDRGRQSRDKTKLGCVHVALHDQGFLISSEESMKK